MVTGIDDFRAQLSAYVGNNARLTPITGGDTCDSWLVEDAGNRYFLKSSAERGTLFYCEAHSLNALCCTQSVRVPTVLDCSEGFLLLEYIAPGVEGSQYWQVLARQLAALHNRPQLAFGFEQDNYCGGSQQPNNQCDDGYSFFSEHRLLYQGSLARDRGRLNHQHIKQLETLCARLPRLIPKQRPALLHGDLWSGNHYAAKDGLPILVDPASYWGWPEADLAMMSLFGSVPRSFFDCYREHHPLEIGLEERLDIYNLYHLLNHLNLFGNAYLTDVSAILQRYG